MLIQKYANGKLKNKFKEDDEGAVEQEKRIVCVERLKLLR
jgi:hypothetical protein